MPLVGPFGSLPNLAMSWLAGWLAGGLACWPAAWLSGWLGWWSASWQAALLAGGQAGWDLVLACWLSDSQTGWLAGFLAALLTSCLAGRMSGCRIGKLKALGKPCGRFCSPRVHSKMAQQMFISVSSRSVFLSQLLSKRRNSKHTIAPCWQSCIF